MTAQPLSAPLRTGTWTVAPQRSTAAFSVRSILHGSVHGTIPVTSGSVYVDSAGRPTRVEAQLDIGNLRTDKARRDKDLRKPQLLDLDTHPSMTFTGDRIRQTPDGWTMEGTLGVKGREVPIGFTVTSGSATGDDEVRLVATARLDRRTAGVRAPRPLIGHTVQIQVDALLTPAG